jgi:hypothetical protein
MMTGQLRISRWPLTVISSGSPGPAPMKCTIDKENLQKSINRMDRMGRKDFG